MDTKNISENILELIRKTSAQLPPDILSTILRLSKKKRELLWVEQEKPERKQQVFSA